MIEAQRRAYLEAMGIGVWINRRCPRCRPLGGRSGFGQHLAVVPWRVDQHPVWAWPDPEGRQESLPPMQTIGWSVRVRAAPCCCAVQRRRAEPGLLPTLAEACAAIRSGPGPIRKVDKSIPHLRTLLSSPSSRRSCCLVLPWQSRHSKAVCPKSLPARECR